MDEKHFIELVDGPILMDGLSESLVEGLEIWLPRLFIIRHIRQWLYVNWTALPNLQ